MSQHGRRWITSSTVHQDSIPCRLKVSWQPLDEHSDWSGLRGTSQTYAIEAQAFVLHCTAVIGDQAIDFMKTNGAPVMGKSNIGSSVVIGPDGRILTPPGENEKLIFADLDLSQVTKAKTFADASGHCEYLEKFGGSMLMLSDSRPDLLWLGADPKAKASVRI